MCRPGGNANCRPEGNRIRVNAGKAPATTLRTPGVFKIILKPVSQEAAERQAPAKQGQIDRVNRAEISRDCLFLLEMMLSYHETPGKASKDHTYTIYGSVDWNLEGTFST